MKAANDKHLVISDDSMFEKRANEMRNKLNVYAGSFQGSAEEFEYFVEAFLLFSDKTTGMIMVSNLKKIMEEINVETSHEGYLCQTVECQRMINQIDSSGDGHISFEDFCTFLQSRSARLIKIKFSAIELEKELDNKQAFNLIDVEGTGYICYAQLIDMFSSLGERISSEQAKEMITVIPTAVLGRVNFKEFCELMNSI